MVVVVIPIITAVVAVSVVIATVVISRSRSGDKTGSRSSTGRTYAIGV
jgi:hypothetical protein